MAKAAEIIGLDCDAEASAGIRLVITSRLKEMCALRGAALDWRDPEGVHDMRVASRRLRSTLKDFGPYMRGNKLRKSVSELKKIADALGAVRDQDIAIIEMEKRATEAPADIAAGIKVLMSGIAVKRRPARTELVKIIGARALAQFQSDFISALDDAVKPPRRKKKGEDESDQTTVSFREAGRSIITANFESLTELSSSLYTPLKTRPLHRMRIAVKRLRYATKLFTACWNEDLATFDKEIAALQTSLGKLHDCDVWIAELGEKLKSLRKSMKPATSDVPLRAASKARRPSYSAAEIESATLWLLSHFVEARTAHFQSATARWHEWDATGLKTRLFSIIER